MKTVLVFNNSSIDNLTSLSIYDKVERLYVPDLIAGTCAGSLIGMMVALEYSSDKISFLLEKLKNDISEIPIFYKGLSYLGFSLESKISEKMQKSLKNIFGNLKMSDLRVDFMCNAYNLTTNEPIMYKSWKPEHKGIELWKIAMSTLTFDGFIDDNGHKIINGVIDLSSLILPSYVEIKEKYTYENIKVIELGNGVKNSNETQRNLFKKLKQGGDIYTIYDI